VGIGIQKINAGIGIPASITPVRYRRKKMSDCVTLLRYRTTYGIVSFFQSGTGLTGCQTDRHSGIQKVFSVCTKMLKTGTKIYHGVIKWDNEGDIIGW
jgi:hypothetical protein